MTLESSLPYLSIGAAAVAGVAAARKAPGSLEPAARAFALAALALFAYFRGVAPSAIAAAATLSAIGEALTPRGADRWRTAGVLFLAAAWLVLAHLFLKAGAGWLAFTADLRKAALLALALLAAGWAAARLWKRLRGVRPGAGLDAGAALLMLAMALSLGWGFWPAMAGAAGVVLAEGLLLAAQAGRMREGAGVRAAAWAGRYIGQAAMAYAFLK